MKKFINIITGVALLSGTMLSSCTKDFTAINTNPNTSPIALPEQLLPTALVSTLTTNMVRNRNFNNELMQVTVDQNDAEGKVFRYDFNRTWADYSYNNWYLQLTNFKDMYSVASQPLTFSKTYQGISLICQSYVYSLLTDTYGDIPFTDSNKGKDTLNFEPAFNTQKEVYFSIFANLEKANSLLSGAPNVDNTDPVFGGVALSWRKFGNSLYLRQLMRLSGKAEVADTVIKKIKEIAETKTGTYPIISTIAESAILRWTGAAPYANPYVTAVREQDFRSPAIGSFFIDNLMVWSDPRMNISLGADGINRWAIAQGSQGFKGVPSGYSPGTGTPKQSYFYSNTSKRSMQTEELGMILNCAEVKFMLAEAVVKGFISGNAQTHYNAGALASIQQWMPTWVNDIQAYLVAADINWDESLSLEEKMERIHLQKYYALFMCDLQQWFEYRRTGHPTLPKGVGLANNGVMPARLNYPVYVQSTNPTNYKLAVANQGPDEIFTEVWWQKK
ncbi:SusD/RagB family nutrient-binding outer membrane lipoprotein [uncultured Chitinophaga sp.]|uniref:SusD/RagB family nutrient-binding outer membrane lipoprotein n=1 Tax=uncultured Chitinophaga sp. TaxID=339340 RepID=UPI0025F4BB08|nr:SusD/RagB family nutrient-binding outer membrane lipoprotein [uncultured Chitinophaga sp.]